MRFPGGTTGLEGSDAAFSGNDAGFFPSTTGLEGSDAGKASASAGTGVLCAFTFFAGLDDGAAAALEIRFSFGPTRCMGPLAFLSLRDDCTASSRLSAFVGLVEVMRRPLGDVLDACRLRSPSSSSGGSSTRSSGDPRRAALL
jgi:hypothetical protein